MSDMNSERSKTWNIYTASNSNSNSNPTGGGVDDWKSSFGTSMSAISFGFVATAILISMFLIMAIFEHLFKPTSSEPESSMLASYHQQEEEASRKEGNPESIGSSSSSYACDLSVMMPGQQYPTYIAQPAPLPCPCPCPREGAHWPSHQHFLFN